MKIAIMTQPLGKNYGGIMQAWALQQVLKSAGHEPVTIDRQPDAKSLTYNAARFGYRSLQKVLGKRKGPINFERYFPTILQQTNRFIEQNLKMSESLDSSAKLKAHFEREQYDAVIVGSDQTWRPCYSPNIDNFFLDFLQGSDIRRIAYASSFGVGEWEFTKEQTQHCAALAKQFDAISVRESSGVDLCRNHLGVEATHVLDPTLLLDRSFYEALYKNKEMPKRNGVYTYILDRASWKDKIVEVVKKELNEAQYCNQSKASFSDFSSGYIDDYAMPSVEGWIKGFADAGFVITDSFHGTIFSIIFNKPFIVLINQSRGASRFYSVLDELCLLDRLVTSFDEGVLKRLLRDKVDCAGANASLANSKCKSENFLREALSV